MDAKDKDSAPVARLEDAIDWKPREPNRFVGAISPDWAQGRGAYGGVVGAGVARAISQGVPEDRVLRSITMAFAGPVEPETDFECSTRLLRAGRNASFVHASLEQEGTQRVVATGAFGVPRESSVSIDGPARPEAPPPEEGMLMPYFEGLTPRFTKQLEIRLTHGAFPFTGELKTEMGGWCRFRDTSAKGDPPGLLAMIDAWPSPVLSGVSMPAPASTIRWAVDFVATDAGEPLDQWWYYSVDAVFAVDGYVSAEASLWSPSGRYVARSSQLVGVFG